MASLESFTEFYRCYHRLVLTVAHQRLGSFLDAEDLTAEVFRIAWREHRAGRELTLPWLYRVLRNCIGNEYRRRRRFDALVERLGTADQPPNQVPEADDDVADLRRQIQALPEGDRELIYMAYWEDLTRAEIAAILGCTAATVRVRLLRARRRLHAALAPDQHPSERVEVSDGRS